MPRQPVRLDEYRDQIRAWLQEDGYTQSDVIDALAHNGQRVSARSLQRELQRLGISIRPRTQVTPELLQLIEELFRNNHQTDHEMLQVLQVHGHEVTPRALARIRKELGLYKRVEAEDEQEAETEARKVLAKELDEGHVENFGVRNLYTYLRAEYGLIGR